jgi:hypothetical protein
MKGKCLEIWYGCRLKRDYDELFEFFERTFGRSAGILG